MGWVRAGKGNLSFHIKSGEDIPLSTVDTANNGYFHSSFVGTLSALVVGRFDGMEPASSPVEGEPVVLWQVVSLLEVGEGSVGIALGDTKEERDLLLAQPWVSVVWGNHLLQVLWIILSPSPVSGISAFGVQCRCLVVSLVEEALPAVEGSA